jgi:hypothetical protein
MNRFESRAARDRTCLHKFGKYLSLPSNSFLLFLVFVDKTLLIQYVKVKFRIGTALASTNEPQFC